MGSRHFQERCRALNADDDGNVILGRGLSLGYFKGNDLRSIVRALEGEANANILSTPSILAMDNEEAKILVGENCSLYNRSPEPTGRWRPVPNHSAPGYWRGTKNKAPYQ